MILLCLSKIVNYCITYAPLATFVGVLVAIFTLLEIRKRRLKSYEPQLFFTNMTFYLQKNSNGTPCILKSDFDKSDDLNFYFFFLIDIRNIGLGAANTISIKWIYNQRKIIKKFEDLGNQTKLLQKDGEEYFRYIYGDDPNQRYGFKIPSSDDSKEEISFLTANQIKGIKIS